MKMTNGARVTFSIVEYEDKIVLLADGWNLLVIYSSGESRRLANAGFMTGLNLDEKGRLAIDQPLPKPPVERFCWVFEMGGQTFDSAPLSEEEASIMLPENRVKLPWTRKTS